MSANQGLELDRIELEGMIQKLRKHRAAMREAGQAVRQDERKKALRLAQLRAELHTIKEKIEGGDDD